MEREADKRKNYTLSAEQLEAIAERGAQLAFEKMTTRLVLYVGRGVLERIFWILGLGGLWLYFFLQSKGIVK